jgi:hypothetical protein
VLLRALSLSSYSWSWDLAKQTPKDEWVYPIKKLGTYLRHLDICLDSETCISGSARSINSPSFIWNGSLVYWAGRTLSSAFAFLLKQTHFRVLGKVNSSLWASDSWLKKIKFQCFGVTSKKSDSLTVSSVFCWVIDSYSRSELDWSLGLLVGFATYHFYIPELFVFWHCWGLNLVPCPC